MMRRKRSVEGALEARSPYFDSKQILLSLRRSCGARYLIGVCPSVKGWRDKVKVHEGR